MRDERSIRLARGGDLPILKDLARRTIDSCYRPFLGDDVIDWYLDSGGSDREVAAHLPRTWVAIEARRPMGLVVAFNDLIHLLMVDVAAHRSGNGTALMAHAERILRNEGQAVLRLETFVDNTAAVAFYQGRGWTVHSQAPDPDTGFDMVQLRKRVS